MVKKLENYSPEMQADFMNLRENLVGAFETFRMDQSVDDRKTERAVYNALRPYEARVPREVRNEFPKNKHGYELSFGIRLRLEQIHNAIFCDK